MTRTLHINGLKCICCPNPESHTIAYCLYPMDFLSGWIEQASQRYATSIVVITGFDWDDAMTPWPAPGVPKGSPDFGGDAEGLLATLIHDVIPAVEQLPGFRAPTSRTLIGVSLSGLFTLWQWMMCDEFDSIGSLSGSFWYNGFVEWLSSHGIPHKSGKAYFLLGNEEASSRVKAFQSVERCTLAIVKMLKDAGIDTTFQSVPGNHYADPIPRLDRAFSALFLS